MTKNAGVLFTIVVAVDTPTTKAGQTTAKIFEATGA